MVEQGSYVELAPEWDDDGWFKFPRSFIRDRRLSWEARAVAAWMASHKTAKDGEPFRFDVPYIVRSGPAGRDKIRGILRELESLGYLERKRERERGLYGPIKHVLHPVPLEPEDRSEFSSQVTQVTPSCVTSSVEVQQNPRSQPAPENPSPDYPSPDFQEGQQREHEVQRDTLSEPPTSPEPQPSPDTAPTVVPAEEGGKDGGGEIPREVWDMLAGITIPTGKRAPGRRSAKLMQVATRCAAILQASETYGLRLGDLRQHLRADLDTVRHSITAVWLHRLADSELPSPSQLRKPNSAPSLPPVCGQCQARDGEGRPERVVYAQRADGKGDYTYKCPQCHPDVDVQQNHHAKQQTQTTEHHESTTAAASETDVGQFIEQMMAGTALGAAPSS